MRELRQKIGQMIMIGLQGEELSQEEKRLVKNFSFGGFILFSHNLKEPKQILSLCGSLWKLNQTPPLIAIDQEGGRVHRLPPPFTHFPPAAVLGRTGNAGLAYKAGLATARELSAVGINLNFAPVLDVHSNPNNPVIGDRALSSEPEQVTQLGWSMIQGLRAGGVIPCAKHFPGHGDTAQDSHLELPVVKKDRAALKSLELPPFIHTCRNQVESLMTAHVLYPSFDSDHPATLSYAIVANLLRHEIDYEGVVFSDDLEMKAISQNYSLENAVSLAIQAGIDVLLFCHQKETAVTAFEFLYREAEKKEIKTRVEESCERVQKLKRRFLKSFTGAHPGAVEDSISLLDHRKIVDEIHGSL